MNQIHYLGRYINTHCQSLTPSSHYMTANNLHIDSQYGYKKHHVTETLLVHLLDEIMVTVDAKLGVVVLIIDLSAAFDTVNHTICSFQSEGKLTSRNSAVLDYLQQICFIEGHQAKKTHGEEPSTISNHITSSKTTSSVVNVVITHKMSNSVTFFACSSS